MMNEAKQSDAVIVSMKGANKGAPAPAECLERRAAAKGNPGSQSTRRDAGSGKRVTSGGPDTAGSHEESEGTPYGASAPCHGGGPERGFSCFEPALCGRS